MPLDLADIQGVVLRSYKMPFLRTLILRIDDAARVKTLLASLPVRTAECWDAKPEYCLNIGLTADGLKALRIPDETLNSFPPEFLLGAAGRAAAVGDTGVNDPANWIDPFRSTQVHILLSLTGQSHEILETVTAQIRSACSGAATEVFCRDGYAPADHRAHFGFVDGISQPRVAGVPAQKQDTPEFSDPMDLVPPGAFVLGYESAHPGHFYPMPAPDALGRNGSFAAFRILQQDCFGFENFLDDAAKQTGLDRELIAAKLVGRWRSGVPLSLASEATQQAAVPFDQWNHFDHSDDPAGRKCPLGSHIRRTNPRRSAVAGSGGETHRIMRRGLPYGAPYDPQNPQDGIERGLLGLFICGDLRDQFEFLMKDWVNDGDFAGLGADKDPILGNQPAPGGRFRIPGPTKPQTVVRGMGTFITTRAGAYFFLPSITALRYLAGLPG
ncbi:MAG: Dyp-type peroxidase [Bryobacteraceae bacterium]